MRALVAVGCFVASLSMAHGADGVPTLQFPVVCTLGETCYVQHLVDLRSGPEVVDPFCGQASYNGHTGTDIRVPQVVDLSANGRVVAAASGVVRALRDGAPDRLMQSSDDRVAVAGEGCGNGLILDHGDGWQTQYCHLASGSVSVSLGDVVDRGQEVGAIGLSGRTQFPHLEFIVRHNGSVIDPFTGASLDQPCGGTSPLWADPSIVDEPNDMTRLIGAGLSSSPVDHDTLMFADPVGLFAGATAVIGWGWAINVQAGDHFEIELTGPDGFYFHHRSGSVPRAQAAYSAFAGDRFTVVTGRYAGVVRLYRGSQVVDEMSFDASVN